MVRFLDHYDPKLPTVISRGELPANLVYGRKWPTAPKGGITCRNNHLRVSMLQPSIFSKAAVDMLAPNIVDRSALVRQCGAFGITHDVSLRFPPSFSTRCDVSLFVPPTPCIFAAFCNGA